MDNTNVAPVAYTQARHTKLGLATVTIRQEGDLWESCVTISDDDTIFKVEGIFTNAREAFHWAYGVKQATNDDWAGYTSKEGILTESHPPKTRKALSYTIAEALKQAQGDYTDFTLSKSSTINDKISMSSVQTSTLLSDEEKALVAAVFSKLQKVVTQ